MDGRLTLTVVTPERALLQGVACDEVTLPARLGEIGVLPGHTPLIALLGIGVVGYRDGARRATLAVRGGFVEIAGDAVRVLADEAAAPEAIDGAKASAEKADAESRRRTRRGRRGAGRRERGRPLRGSAPRRAPAGLTGERAKEARHDVPAGGQTPRHGACDRDVQARWAPKGRAG